MTLITVKILKQLLNGLPDETLIILSSDSEGNQFSPAYSCTPQAAYIPEERYHNTVGDIVTPNEVAYHKRQAKPAFVLWPAR